MGREVKIGLKPCRRRKKIERSEPEVLYVRIEDDVYEVLGRHNSGGTCNACLRHVLTEKRFDYVTYGDLALELKNGRAKRLNEMEVLAWAAK